MNSEHMGSYAETSSGRMHYIERGEGDVLILVHGLCQSLYTWHCVFHALSESYRVIAVDLPGMGYSDRPETDEGLLVPAVADALVSLMDALEIDYAHFAAFSTGAVYVLELAERYPERCGRLILTSPGGIVNTMPGAVRALSSPLAGVFASASVKKTEKLLTDAFFDKTLITQEMVKEYYKPLANKERMAALKSAFRAFDDTDVTLHLRDVKSEVLMLWGVDDRWREVMSAETYQVALPMVEFTLVRNCGHILHEEKWERYIDFVQDFIENGIMVSDEQ